MSFVSEFNNGYTLSEYDTRKSYVANKKTRRYRANQRKNLGRIFVPITTPNQEKHILRGTVLYVPYRCSNPKDVRKENRSKKLWSDFYIS